jgi:hypothetical protein
MLQQLALPPTFEEIADDFNSLTSGLKTRRFEKFNRFEENDGFPRQASKPFKKLVDS